MTVQERIAKVVAKTRALWAMSMVAASLTTAIWLPLWWLLPLVVLGIVTYYGSLLLAALYLSFTIDREEVSAAAQEDYLQEFNQRLARGDDLFTPENQELAQKAGVFASPAVSKSPEIVGRFRDFNIYEWIEVPQRDGTVIHLKFHSVAPHDQFGNAAVPDEEGVALFEGSLYRQQDAPST